ncbi:sensor domain-containing protein [Kitasatospora sp. NPDC056783]|uniref:sensor histidine kinase n=1 Tax=Kitasatospora sp. NPDC056783 TaxID=3345943 RepID=UPI00367D763B
MRLRVNLGSLLREFPARLGRAGTDLAVGVLIATGALLSVCLFLITAYFVILFVIGIGAMVLPIVTRWVRWLCNANRRVAARSGIEIAVPYQPEPDEFEKDIVGWIRRCKWILTDQATWRDLAWLLLNSVVGMIGFLPAAVLYYVLEGFALAFGLWKPVLRAQGTGREYFFVAIDSYPTAVLAALAAAALFVAWAWFSPLFLTVHAHFSRLLLGPTESSRLALRVQHLAETRTGALDAAAAELRRIERDLHDGAQARLVGLGLTLGALERHLTGESEEARRLLRDARTSSVAALRELRDLVRGIHPPILAERGLADALRALGLASPLQVEVEVSIPGEAPPPLESALYFAVSELLTNALKYSEAEHVEVSAWHDGAVLHAWVTDDGRGGADTTKGTGLHGIRRRLATFDGTLDISSPLGGPTVIKMEIPCVLSSLKTSSS